MQVLSKISYRLLYILWAGMFCLTAVLGFAFPLAEEAPLVLLRLAAVAFFIPPWCVLLKAKKESDRKNRALVRNLAIASLVGTTALLAANILSAGQSETLGNVLYAVLTVVSAPMVCSHYYSLSLLGWAMLLTASLGKMKTK